VFQHGRRLEYTPREAPATLAVTVFGVGELNQMIQAKQVKKMAIVTKN
jgi:hypothetical protein